MTHEPKRLTEEQLLTLRTAPVTVNRVRVAMALTDASVGEIAVALEPVVNYWTVSRITKGKHQPGLPTARAFADYFGCRIEDLFPSQGVAA